MIFNAKDKVAPIKHSTRIILDGTLGLVREETGNEEILACLVSKLTAALTLYNSRCLLFSNSASQTQIASLQSSLRYINTTATLSATEKYDCLCDELKNMIADIETNTPNSYLLYCFKEKGLYKTLYEVPCHQGVIDANLQALVNVGFERVLVSAGLLVLYGALGAMGMPIILMALLNGAFAGAYMYLNGVIDGIYTQRRAARESLPSLLLGYDNGHYSVMKSNHRLPQAIAWGMIESTERAYLAGVVFFLAAMTLTFFCSVNMWVFPLMTIMTPIVSKLVALCVRSPYQKELNLYTNAYQQKASVAMAMTHTEKNAWSMNLKRKRMAHRAFISSMFLGLSGLICSSLLSAHLPVVFGTLLLNTVLPFTCIVPVTLLIAAAGVYLYQKKNEQHNNRFKLSFEPKEAVEISDFAQDEESALYELMKSQEHKTDPASLTYSSRVPPDGMESYQEESESHSYSLSVR